MVMLQCYVLFVKITEHPIERQMRQRLHHEVLRAQEIKERMEFLSPAYNEFVDLREEYAKRKTRAGILLGLIDDDLWTTNPNWAETDASKLTGSSVKELRSKLPLWEAMREYLQHVS